jgi:hypothetical protein
MKINCKSRKCLGREFVRYFGAYLFILVLRLKISANVSNIIKLNYAIFVAIVTYEVHSLFNCLNADLKLSALL